jgi:hypothetical protein
VTCGERRIGEEVSWKGDSGRLERGRAEGPGMRKGWRGMGLNLTIYYTARDDNLSSYFYYGNHSKGAR